MVKVSENMSHPASRPIEANEVAMVSGIGHPVITEVPIVLVTPATRALVQDIRNMTGLTKNLGGARSSSTTIKSSTTLDPRIIVISAPAAIKMASLTTQITELILNMKGSDLPTVTLTLFVLVSARLLGACLKKSTKAMPRGERNCLRKWSIRPAFCAQRPTTMSGAATSVISRTFGRNGSNSRALLHLQNHLLWGQKIQ